MRWQRWLRFSIIPCLLLLAFALLMPYVYQARLAARKSTLKNQLKQFGLALHNYHETHGSMPPGGVIHEDGTAMNGWITMIMPFMDASPYYNWLDFNKSWESSHNVFIFEQAIPYNLSPNVSVDYTTTGYGLTHFLANPNLFYRNSCVKLNQMKNGTTHTWMAGEVAGNFQPWSYPFNWRSLGTKLCEGPESFGDPDWKGGHLLMADGRVSFFSEETSAEILRQLANVPPVATKEQATAPANIFQTGLYHWKRIDLQADPESKAKLYVNVLRNKAGAALVIRAFTFEEIEPSEENVMSKTWNIPIPDFLLQIDSTTDIAKALEATTLFKAATPEQFQANVKTLEAIQGQLE